MTTEKWIPVAETRLAKELGGNLIRAGQLFKQAGFKKSRHANSHLGNGQRAHVEAGAANLDEIQITTIVRQKSTIKPAAKWNLTPPTYSQLVKALEDQQQIINQLKDENNQLRQHLAQATANNGMGERARKALAAVRQSSGLLRD